MKCLILAAGYATRLYPLTENFPKSLLKIKEKTILDWLIDDLMNSNIIDEYIIISNAKYFSYFKIWAKERKLKNLTILNDRTNSNENRLGAVKDIIFTVNKLKLNDDLFIMASDTLLDFSLTNFLKYAIQKNTSCVMRFFEEQELKLKNYGILEIDQNDKVISVEEKPEYPKSNWCCPPFYFYKKEDLDFILKNLNISKNFDAPGNLIAWLIHYKPIYAMEMPGKDYDIGNLENYNWVKNNYKGIIK